MEKYKVCEWFTTTFAPRCRRSIKYTGMLDQTRPQAEGKLVCLTPTISNRCLKYSLGEEAEGQKQEDIDELGN